VQECGCNHRPRKANTLHSSPGREGKQAASPHTPTMLTLATLPTHVSPATARTPKTASASNSPVGESSSSSGNFSSHRAKETEQGKRVTNWAGKPQAVELPPGLGSNHVPGQERGALCLGREFH